MNFKEVCTEIGNRVIGATGALFGEDFIGAQAKVIEAQREHIESLEARIKHLEQGTRFLRLHIKETEKSVR